MMRQMTLASDRALEKSPGLKNMIRALTISGRLNRRLACHQPGLGMAVVVVNKGFLPPSGAENYLLAKIVAQAERKRKKKKI